MEKTRTEQQQLFAVSGTTKREREVSARWAWTEPAVWTERMVDALERGVKGGKWHSLIDKVYAERTLSAAWRKVERNGGSGGVDGERIRDFKQEAGKRLTNLSEQLQNDRYEPMPIRRVYIPKLGSHELRPLGIPTIRDRVVQTALRSVIEPIFERDFSDNSYGFRPGRSAKGALKHVDRLLAEGRTWVVDAPGYDGDSGASFAHEVAGAESLAVPTINAGQMPTSGRWVSSPCPRPMPCSSALYMRPINLESRMREIRTYGSEGGGAYQLSLPL